MWSSGPGFRCGSRGLTPTSTKVNSTPQACCEKVQMLKMNFHWGNRHLVIRSSPDCSVFMGMYHEPISHSDISHLEGNAASRFSTWTVIPTVCSSEDQPVNTGPRPESAPTMVSPQGCFKESAVIHLWRFKSSSGRRSESKKLTVSWTSWTTAWSVGVSVVLMRIKPGGAWVAASSETNCVNKFPGSTFSMFYADRGCRSNSVCVFSSFRQRADGRRVGASQLEPELFYSPGLELLPVHKVSSAAVLHSFSVNISY